MQMDDELHRAARIYCAERGLSLAKLISRLLKEALASQEDPTAALQGQTVNGLPLLRQVYKASRQTMNNLRLLRTQNNIRQIYLAKQLGKNHNYVSQYELGYISITEDRVKEIETVITGIVSERKLPSSFPHTLLPTTYPEEPVPGEDPPDRPMTFLEGVDDPDDPKWAGRVPAKK